MKRHTFLNNFHIKERKIKKIYNLKFIFRFYTTNVI